MTRHGRLSHVVIAVLLFALVGVLAEPTAAELGDVAALVVIHRHGARFPVAAPHSEAICGDQCGDLTPTGKRMLFTLGQTLQREYPSLQFRSAGALRTLGSSYDARRVTSFSTDTERTLDSASAFVKGLLAPPGATLDTLPANVSAVLPAIRGRPVAEATAMIVWASWPSLMLHSSITTKAFNAMMYKRLSALFTVADIQTIGQELGGTPLCDGSAVTFFDCLLAAQDVITCAFSNEPAATVHTKYPWMASNFDRLTNVMVIYNAVSMYNASQPFDHAIGTKGFLLAQEILGRVESDIIQAPTAGAKRERPVVIEYSGHDITLMPFSETIGNTSLTNPTFAGAFVLEVRRPASAMGRWSVRLRYGEPEQRYGSDAAYGFFDFGLKCTDASGTTTDANPATGCAYADWARFLSTRGPASPAGICFLPEADLAAINCTVGTDEAPPANAQCREYRSKCPRWACRAPAFDPADTAYALDPVSLACVEAAGPKATSGHDIFDTMPTGVLLGFTALGTALVCAAALAVALCCCCDPTEGDEDKDGVAAGLVAGGDGEASEGGDRESTAVPRSSVGGGSAHHHRPPPSRWARLRDRFLRCCCCTRAKMRERDAIFFASGTDVAASDACGPSHRSATSTAAHAAVGIGASVNSGGGGFHPHRQPKLRDVPYSGTLSPRRRLSFGQSTTGDP